MIADVIGFKGKTEHDESEPGWNTAEVDGCIKN